MKEYSIFNNTLEKFLCAQKFENSENWRSEAIRFVDGSASEELRRLVSLKVRREFGAFFTESELAEKVLRYSKLRFGQRSFFYDPTCGAGNLLIAIANLLYRSRVNYNIEQRLFGTDIQEEFVKATRLRLAINRSLYKENNQQISFLKENIIVNNALQQNEFYEQATHVIVNPPYNLIDSTGSLSWSKGKVSSAALFIERIIQFTNSGTTIVAILPDVLRSGSRYQKWRELVNKECLVERTKLLGQFDKYADVDVFSMVLVKRRKTIGITTDVLGFRETKPPETLDTLDSSYDICVGPVVDNRDPRLGTSRSYLLSKGLKDWSQITKIHSRRRHTGKAFTSPLVVIKRTSRLGDMHRAAAVLINTPEPIYIDNHLIVVKPKSGKFSDCKKLLEILSDTRTNAWLNKKIRCRHLTVKILAKLPLWR